MPHAALGAQHDLVPDTPDALSHGLLVVGGGAVWVGAGVALGGVEQGVPQVKGGPDLVGGLPLPQGCAEGVAQAHAAQPHPGDLHAGLSQSLVLHV